MHDRDRIAYQRQGTLLALDAVEHYLNNSLALTAVCCELMRDDPRVPEDLRQHAARALEGIAAASLWIDTLRAIARSSDTLHEFANVRPRVHSLALRERKAESA